MSVHPDTFEIEQHLRQMNEEWVKAMTNGDGPTLDRIMAEDFVFSYPLEGDDKAQFIADCVSGDLKIQHINRDQVSVRVFGPTAMLTARDTANWIYHGREISGQYKILNVYSLREGEWKLCAVQACPIHP
ncbi:MAG TPA: nuclear transport factor 2 family protein [Pyrinomonadaceae bacterium]|jgi:ketosteroid isomerase-like protein|nr:nuclear transport factor 2 family protein [Pyrinomonadaceae bacterium]